MTSFYERFVKLRDEKDSLIIVGLDPKDDSQVNGVFQLTYLRNGIIGFKPNRAFYDNDNKGILREISRNIGPDLIKLLDTKASDGANTNDASFKRFQGLYDSVTIAPAAGCIEETIDKANKRNFDTISMGAMSFSGVLREINSALPHLKERVDRSIDAGTAGFVLGATAFVPEDDFGKTIDKYRNLKSDAAIRPNQMSGEELELALLNRNKLFTYIVQKMYENPSLVALVPGFGRQGGNLEHFLASGVDLNRCMINAGSDILKASNYQKAINEMQATFNDARQYY